MTLASALSKISSIRVNIVTVEDPVEIINSRSQPSSGESPSRSDLRFRITLDFAARSLISLWSVRFGTVKRRSWLYRRRLPDISFFSTLHTNNSSAALPRLLDMDIEAIFNVDH